MRICTFLSRRDAEELVPPLGYHLVSISDDRIDQAKIDESRWASVSYHHFVDAGFDEDVIEFYGQEFEANYVDYLLAGKADTLRARLDGLANTSRSVVVNCQAGRSRSAAVAMYLQKHHGYQVDQPMPDANLCVYRMLAKDASLMNAYEASLPSPDLNCVPGRSRKLFPQSWRDQIASAYVPLMFALPMAGALSLLFSRNLMLGMSFFGSSVAMFVGLSIWKGKAKSGL